VNSFNTGWLDELIAAKEQADKPDLILSLICGSLNIAHQVCYLFLSLQNFRVT
jgi:hypothetical protein